MRLNFLFLLIVCLCCGCGDDSPANSPDDPVAVEIRGADVSFLPEIENYPTTFYNADNDPSDVLDILKESGCNYIRIRLWHTPTNAHSGLQEVLTLSNRAKAKGMKVWLTVHYSDTWADPGHQTKPVAWSALNFTDLGDSVYNYTKKIVLKLQPDIVQIGNETNDGFLWPEGKMSVNLSNFATLLKKGVQAVRDFAPTSKVMIHYAGHEEANWYYQQLKNQNVPYDMIGLSYYPLWHGKVLTTLKSNMNELATNFEKEIVIAETSYPFTLSWDDNTNNIVGLDEQLVAGYPATPEGQKKFMLRLKKIISEVENGKGFCYWAPEWVAFKGSSSTSGSTGENLALFDFTNTALPALKAFE
jgi:arabinogalactan endo-1,4-beta-galactosidase